jgi:hypothetical protein
VVRADWLPQTRLSSLHVWFKGAVIMVTVSLRVSHSTVALLLTSRHGLRGIHRVPIMLQ